MVVKSLPSYDTLMFQPLGKRRSLLERIRYFDTKIGLLNDIINGPSYLVLNATLFAVVQLKIFG